jgi:hypothetical protein
LSFRGTAKESAVRPPAAPFQGRKPDTILNARSDTDARQES